MSILFPQGAHNSAQIGARDATFVSDRCTVLLLRPAIIPPNSQQTEWGYGHGE